MPFEQIAVSRAENGNRPAVVVTDGFYAQLDAFRGIAALMVAWFHSGIVNGGKPAIVAPAERRVGVDRKRCKEMTWLFPFERIPAATPSAHMLHQYLEFATYLGIQDEHITWDLAGSPYLVQGDITRQDVDAVVNAANSGTYTW